MYRLQPGETVIGRASTVAIKLGDDGISRRHARVIVEGSVVRIEDLQSSNGTLVNGARVDVQTLKDGDKIQIGSTTILKFTYHDKLEESFQQQMYDAALRDGLTKAYNKKHFSHRLETELAYAKRHNSALSLLMYDVDHFKRVNDTFGHLAGDHVLAKLAQVTASTLRTEDIFGRYGGEEFAILCRGVNMVNAAILAERIRTLVQSTPFVFETKTIPVTVSVGVAAFPELNFDDPLELIGAADEALYEAKRSGRNRVILKT
jgi:diguanylate cyclase (GGDEF)-like protein